MQNALKSALLSVLRPLVRHLIGQGCTFGTFVDLLKMVYVGETINHFGGLGGKSLSDSRLSLMTGIHRKEVKRLREMLLSDGTEMPLRADASVASRVVALWVSMPAYRGAQNLPKPLPMRCTTEPDFEGLVRLAKADVRPRAVLDELIRAGVAEVDIQDGRIVLLRQAYVSDVAEDKLAFLGHNVGDHLQAAVYNLERTPPYLERALFFNQIPLDTLARLRPEIERLGASILTQTHGLIEQGRTAADDGPLMRMRLGVYYFEAPAEPESEFEPETESAPKAAQGDPHDAT